MPKPTILIAEDDSDLAQILTAKCRLVGFEVFRSPDAMHALLGAHRVKPALIVLDLNMPGGNGLSVCEMIASDPTVRSIPVILMSGQSDEDTIRRCRMAGALFVPKGPKLWKKLAAAMLECLRCEPQTADLDYSAWGTDSPSELSPIVVESGLGNRPKILSIDDDPDLSRVLKLRLEPYGVDVFRAFSGMQGFWSSLDLRPDVIVSDLTMDDGDGNYILQRLQGHSLTEKTPVIILTGQTNPAIKRQLLCQGAVAYLTKPLVIADLVQQLRPLVKLADVPAAGPSGRGPFGSSSVASGRDSALSEH